MLRLLQFFKALLWSRPSKTTRSQLLGMYLRENNRQAKQARKTNRERA
jgi:hypothetical protein